MSSAEQQFGQAIEQAKQAGYHENPSGEWVTPDGRTLPTGIDPKPVQEAAIALGFEQATETPGFDIWTVVDRSMVREGDSLADNFSRVVSQFQASSEDVAEEVASQLEAMGEDLYAGVEAE